MDIYLRKQSYPYIITSWWIPSVVSTEMNILLLLSLQHFTSRALMFQYKFTFNLFPINTPPNHSIVMFSIFFAHWISITIYASLEIFVCILPDRTISCYFGLRVLRFLHIFQLYFSQLQIFQQFPKEMQPAGFNQRSPECTFFYIPSPFFSLRVLDSSSFCFNALWTDVEWKVVDGKIDVDDVLRWSW